MFSPIAVFGLRTIPLALLSIVWPTHGLASELGTRGIALPLYDLQSECDDSRYPALAGPWIVYCTSGQVNRVRSLRTGQDFQLPFPHTAPGLGENRIFSPGRDGGMVALTPSGPKIVENARTFKSRLLAPPAVSEDWIGVIAENAKGHSTAQAFPVNRATRTTFQTEAAGWYPPALSPPYLAWVQNAGVNGEDIMWVNVDEDREPQPLATGEGHQRHIVASGHHFAWVEEDSLVILDLQSQTQQSFPTKTGFSAPPALYEGLACWEIRAGADMDIQCSNNLKIERPGHQEAPSLFEDWLIFREDNRVFIYRMNETVLPPGLPSP